MSAGGGDVDLALQCPSAYQHLLLSLVTLQTAFPLRQKICQAGSCYADVNMQQCGIAGGSREASTVVNLHEGNALLGLLVEQGNALLEALLVSLP